MASSSVPAARTALIAALQARPNLGGVSVTRQWPGPTPPKEFICLGRTVSTEVAASLGGIDREETYAIEVLVMVMQPGRDVAEAAEDRFWQLVAEVAAAVSPMEGATDLGIVDGVSIRALTAEMGGVTMETFAQADGWSVEAQPALINVTARIK